MSTESAPATSASPVLSEAARSHLHWALTDGVGPMLFARLIERFGSAASALGAGAAALSTIERVGRRSADKIARARDAVRIEPEIAAAAAAGVRIICRDDEEYPAGLRRIPDPPIVLYVRGQLRAEDAVSLAVVGSRRCTIYGSAQARRFGELLAGAGFTVVSGLARGIDAFAHHGAVDAGGRSIAVLGNGLQEIYPPENAALAQRLCENGACISELPIAASVRSQNFPNRNRIIAGMTLGTLVVEAAHRSGALITARLASQDYNREVFAIPGQISEPMAFGTNALIRSGEAKLVTCLDDILDELGSVGELLSAGRERTPPPPRPGGQLLLEPPDEPPPPPGLSEAEERVYAVVPSMPTLQESVLNGTSLTPGEVLAAFTALELKGLIKRLPGQMVVRAQRSDPRR